MTTPAVQAGSWVVVYPHDYDEPWTGVVTSYDPNSDHLTVKAIPGDGREYRVPASATHPLPAPVTDDDLQAMRDWYDANREPDDAGEEDV